VNNFLDPAILFFLFGLLAAGVRSNLEIPPAISRFLSLYLMMALGLKGGFALAQSGLTMDVVSSLGAAITLALLVPCMSYLLLKRWISRFDAAAVAATYGSVSAVTFITAIQFLENQGVVYAGYMAAAMALMESPAIIVAVVLANRIRQKQRLATQTPEATPSQVQAPPSSMGKVLHESITDGAQLLLLGAMAVGLLSGEAGAVAMQPFVGDLFKGMLAFFLLDMGLTTARNASKVRDLPWHLWAYALLAPLVHAGLALGLAWGLGLPVGNAALLMVLAASASYIAVPAVLRYAVPEASPSVYLGLSLGVTFPFNILVGIPLYTSVALRVLG